MNTAALLWASLQAAQAGQILPDGALEETFDNGLTVVVLPLSSELVALQVWVSVGSRHEVLAGTTGYAHFFEHLMFRGSENYSAQAREATMLKLSAVDNAWTSTDHTCYHALAPADRLDALLDLEADRLQALALTPESVEQESGAVMGELRKDASSPGSRLYTTLYDTAFTTHTYKHMTIGLEADVLAMASGFDVARAFYADHYRPERVTVVIAGGVEPAATVEAVRQRLAGWSPPPAPPRALHPH
jgi:zinc protease